MLRTSQGYLTHGRIDGPVPPKKQKEFEVTQARLKRQGSGPNTPRKREKRERLRFSKGIWMDFAEIPAKVTVNLKEIDGKSM